MASAGFRHTVLLRSGGSAVAVGDNGNGQCNIPPLDEGMAYTHISAGNRHTVLLRSDGSAVAIGDNLDGQCDIPPLDEGLAYAQVSAGGLHTVLLRSDGSAVAIGDNSDGQCDIPPLDEGMTYTQISGGYEHTVLLRSDGSAIAIGFNCYGQCDIPPLDEGIAYNQVSAGHHHTVLLRSNGSAVAIGDHFFGQCYIPPLNEGMAYTQISAGLYHTVLLRSDGCAVAVGDGQCNIPPLDEGMTYTQISAGGSHTVLLLCDGSAVACGGNGHGQSNIPTPPGICYIDTISCGRDLALQVEFVRKDDAVTLICSTLAGEERFRSTAQGVDSVWETHKRIAREVNVNLPNLQLVLPDGQLLAKVCRANPGASVAEVAQSSGQTCYSNSFWTTAQIGQALKSKKVKGSGAAADWMVCLIWIWLCLKIGIHPTPLVDHHLPYWKDVHLGVYPIFRHTLIKVQSWQALPFWSTIPLVLVEIYVLGFEKDLFVGCWTSRYN